MLGKIYFLFASGILLLSILYQLVATEYNPGFYYLFQIGINLLVILGGYSHYFKKKMFNKKIWEKVFYGLILSLSLSFILQFAPKLLKGDFSIYYFNLSANLLGFILGTILFVPLYVAMFKLSRK